MPEFLVVIDESVSGGTRTYKLNKVVTIPGIKRVTGIRLRNRVNGQMVTNRVISHSLNSDTQKVTISGTLDNTGFREVSGYHKLINDTVNGSTRYCTYEGGRMQTTSADNYCVNFMTSMTTYYDFDYDILIDYTVNTAPGMTVQTEDNLLVREGDVFPLRIEVNELDSGDVVDIQYFINDSMTGSLGNYTSESIPLLVERDFLYENGRLTDPVSGQSIALAEGQNHTLRIEARDNFGGTAPAQTLTFTVDTNIPSVIAVNPFQTVTNALAGDSIEVSGTVSDPNGNTLTLAYQVNNGTFQSLVEGVGQAFSFVLPLSELKDGDNALLLRATDQNGAITGKWLNVRRELVKQPLLVSHARYRLNMPTRTASKATVKIMRQTGDLVVSVQVSMTGREEDERFVPMPQVITVPLGGGMEEDEFVYQADGQKEKMTLWLTLTRTNAASTQKILRISGELNE